MAWLRSYAICFHSVVFNAMLLILVLPIVLPLIHAERGIVVDAVLMSEDEAGTLAALEKTSAADLDMPGPKATERLAATMGDLFLLQGLHWFMHTGQWAVTRRKLGRKPLF